MCKIGVIAIIFSHIRGYIKFFPFLVAGRAVLPFSDIYFEMKY
jgi:hypothetical protein